MARLLGADLFELVTEKNRLMRYVVLGYRTCCLFRKRDYQMVFVMNPSVVLAVIAVILGKWYDVQVIVDAHNAGVYPAEGKSRLLAAMCKFASRHAKLTIVTNQALVQVVHSWKANAIAMIDPLPQFAGWENAQGEMNYDVLFVCTWAEDEPYNEVLQAAEHLPAVKFAITGKFKKVLSDTDACSVPSNVTLTGFVSESEYLELLHHSNVVLDLTLRDDCLVCGAYESIAAGRPCIISDTQINRQVFTSGFVYSRNDAGSIKEAVVDALERQEFLEHQISLAKQAMRVSEAGARDELFQRLAAID